MARSERIVTEVEALHVLGDAWLRGVVGHAAERTI